MDEWDAVRDGEVPCEGTLLGTAANGRLKLRLREDGSFLLGGFPWDATGSLDDIRWEPGDWRALMGIPAGAGLPAEARGRLAASLRESRVPAAVESLGLLVLMSGAWLAAVLRLGTEGRDVLAAAIACAALLAAAIWVAVSLRADCPTRADAGGRRIPDGPLSRGIAGILWYAGLLASLGVGFAVSLAVYRTLGPGGWSVAAGAGCGMTVLLFLLLVASALASRNRGSGRLTRLVGRLRPGGSVPAGR